MKVKVVCTRVSTEVCRCPPNTTKASTTKNFMAKNCQHAKHGRKGREMLQLTSP